MNKKSIINLIEKMAQTRSKPPSYKDVDINDPTSKHISSVTPSVSSSNKSNNSVGASYIEDPNVKKMQEALVNFSKSFISQKTDTVSIDTNKPNRKTFADYLSSNYLQDSSVLENMKQLSDPKIVNFPIDGKWGPKTYAALHKITEFAQSLFKIVNQYKMHVTSYKEDELNGFIDFINGDHLTQIQKTNNATLITKHIIAISNLYSEIMKYMMDSPALKEQIEGAPPEQETLPPKVIEALNHKYNNFMIQIVAPAGVVQKKITVNDFSSKEALQKWKQDNLGPQPMTLSQIVSQIKKQVEAMQ